MHKEVALVEIERGVGVGLSDVDVQIDLVGCRGNVIPVDKIVPHAKFPIPGNVVAQNDTGFGHGGETVTRSRHLVGRVALNRVVMRYAPNQEPALAGVSLEVSPGEIVALAGPNGSGKSTILKLVMDLYRPQAGTVMIDGIDVRQLNPHDLRRSIGYMPQETELFSGTVGDNLRLANPIAGTRR